MYNWHAKSRILVLILFLGDVAVFSLALWLSLTIRFFLPYGKYFWSYRLFLYDNLLPFSLVFLLWILVLYLAGFYRTLIIGYRLSLAQSLLRVHFINSVIAVIFFYIFLPYFYISPKVNLVLYLLFSYILLFLWRAWSVSFLKAAFGRGALYIVGPERELQEITHAFHYNPYYENIKIVSDVSVVEEAACGGTFAAVVASSSLLNSGGVSKKFYDAFFKGVQFFNFQKFYESVFHKIPLSLVDETWLLENISSPSRALYDFTKILADILIAVFIGCISLVFYPFIILAIKLDDSGPIFHIPKRVGAGGKIFDLFKFRTMRVDADARWPEKNDPRVTRVGRFLRKTSLDELPQLWNVFLGNISMVGPRPDLVDFAEVLEKQIPYYKVRTLIKPGLTGWAQVSQKFLGDRNPSSIEETKERLAYDLYYIKNRSFLLDLAIILKTINLVLSRIGFLR
ncbi:MAG: Sugar transferase [Parcubacteria group bacterium GW2011_GWC1_44_10]|nr:MAG: Sugar transferase [Parcubacteria group bacterium GW2011_GWC1_44_10]